MIWLSTKCTHLRKLLSYLSIEFTGLLSVSNHAIYNKALFAIGIDDTVIYPFTVKAAILICEYCVIKVSDANVLLRHCLRSALASYRHGRHFKLRVNNFYSQFKMAPLSAHAHAHSGNLEIVYSPLNLLHFLTVIGRFCFFIFPA